MKLLRHCARLFVFAVVLHMPVTRAPGQASQSGDSFRVLVFTKTASFRHSSIPISIHAFERLGLEGGFVPDFSEDAGRFTDAGLAPYRVVVFLNTTGDILDSDQQAAFERYIRHGGGFAGIHAAADTEYDWPWFGELVGARFASHPAVQTGVVVVADPVFPATRELPERWIRTDEWYDFRENPRGKVHILATLDERTTTGSKMGFDHPVSWCRRFDGGRSWYTALGHTEESYSDPPFLRHLLGGLRAAAGVEPATFEPTLDARFRRVTLDDGAKGAMQIAPMPDGRILFIERGGSIKIFRPDLRHSVLAGRLDVATAYEDGLLGAALDPAFASNGWVYLFYSPAGPIEEQRLSRFTMEGDRLVTESEVVVLRIPTERRECCHSAGGLAFGPDGNLFIATGDNTNPFASDGFAPTDERPGRASWDAQRTSGNSGDLRGKILRIRPRPDGGYDNPAGNLFPPGSPDTRTEIYVMGVRNPFRLSIDPLTGDLYWGDVGPDAKVDSSTRGPMGYDEINRAVSAGNFGWPYCIADNQPYHRYDFETAVSGPHASCDEPTNDSPNNTGARMLPPAQPAWVWYPYGPSGEFPEMGTGGRTAITGPVIRQAARRSAIGLPDYYDGALLVMEWSRNRFYEMRIDENGGLLKINPFLASFPFDHPIDMKLGPGRALYLLEWGSDGGAFPASRLSRIEFDGFDLTGDERLTVADAIRALRIAAGGEPFSPAHLPGGDGNGDGRIDVSDAILMLRRLTGA